MRVINCSKGVANPATPLLEGNLHMADTVWSSLCVRHPLEPLTPEEIAAAVAIVRAGQARAEHMRFVMVKLHEPPPEVALSYKPGDSVPREVFLSLLDKMDGKGAAYEAIVNLTEGEVSSWKRIEGVQPSSILAVFVAWDDAVSADPDFQAST